MTAFSPGDVGTVVAIIAGAFGFCYDGCGVVIRLGSLMAALFGLLFAALHYWPPHGW